MSSPSTSFRVHGQAFLQLRINGDDVDFSKVGYGYACLRTHVLWPFPALDFELVDPADVLRTNVMRDGSVVDIAISDDAADSNPQYHSYRVFKCIPQKIVGSGTKYRVVCYWNAPGFLLDKKVKSFKDQSASAVVEQIGGEFGFSVDADPTSDSQTWICRNMTYAQWMRRELLQHAYSSPSSAYIAGTSFDTGVLHFRNLPDLMTTPPAVTLASTASEHPGRIVTEARAKAYNGLFNILGGGYGYVSQNYDITKDDYSKSAGVQVKVAQGDLNMASDLVGRTSRFDFDPVNVGNVHDKYYQAPNQNCRILSSYSQALELMVGGFSGVDLMDTVLADVSYLINQTRTDDYLTAPYVVIGKAAVIRGPQYAERLCLIRNTVGIPV